jgi:hypothetical protein
MMTGTRRKKLVEEAGLKNFKKKKKKKKKRKGKPDGRKKGVEVFRRGDRQELEEGSKVALLPLQLVTNELQLLWFLVKLFWKVKKKRTGDRDCGRRTVLVLSELFSLNYKPRKAGT